ncbi:hypothetical protein LBMAG44_07490 [Gemmatimonadota bacterium]|nr:hypothetical protein LBMAG44_07490 [Gemmatimonadota bacterium]
MSDFDLTLPIGAKHGDEQAFIRIVEFSYLRYRLGATGWRHRMAYRVDDGVWRALANLGKRREIGGEVGLIVVP